MCTWGYAASIGVLGILVLSDAFIQGSADTLEIPMSVAAIGALAFGIFTLILILRYRRQLADAAQHARRTWAAVAAGA